MDMSGLHLIDPGTTPEGIARAVEGFYVEYGYQPEVAGRGPGRVNLMGEHTDYNRGCTLPIALPHATYAAVAAREDTVVRIASGAADGVWTGSLAQIAPGQVSGWAAYAAGVFWSLRNEGVDVPGADIYLHSTVPLGAGLSSSAAVEAAVAVALWVLSGREPAELDPAQLVDVCIDAETLIAGAPTGGMDQCAALLSSPGTALFIDFDKFSCYDVELNLEDTDTELLVVDSSIRHQLTDGSYGSRREECERAAAKLGVASLRQASPEQVQQLSDPVLRARAWHVLQENARVEQTIAAFDSGDLDRVGALFNESHASLRDYFQVSCPEVDTLVDQLTRAGALGARMTGGGFGGSVVALVPHNRFGPACLAVQATFRTAGWQPPRFLRLSPSEPATAVRL
ncbi:MAG: galactokinase [Nocardioides sp.]|jgi:galactokinase